MRQKESLPEHQDEEVIKRLGSVDFHWYYGEEIIKAIQDLKGVNLGGRNVDDLKFADDVTPITDSE